MTWLPKKRVVVPVDFSDASEEAIRVALEVVEDPSDVDVLFVVQPIPVAEPGMLWGSLTDDERVVAAAKALQDRYRTPDRETVKWHVVLGIPAHAIADHADTVSADLIVIPSHGRSGVSRFFLGSVTEKVLRMANCEVLVLRVREDDGETS